MNFSVCLIAKNEEKTLPRMIGSLKEFQSRGGEILLLDTGSTDNTAKVAEELGCIVYKVDDKFKINIVKELSNCCRKYIPKGRARGKPFRIKRLAPHNAGPRTKPPVFALSLILELTVQAKFFIFL